jgi:hypothetical protein
LWKAIKKAKITIRGFYDARYRTNAIQVVG